MEETFRKFRSRLLDLGHYLRKAYARKGYGSTISVQEHVTVMYSGFDKVGLFQPQTQVENLDFVRFGMLQAVYSIVPEAVTTIQSEKRFERTVWTLRAIIRRFVSPAYSTNGKALLMSDFDDFQESTHLLKRFASGQGFYSSVISITVWFT